MILPQGLDRWVRGFLERRGYVRMRGHDPFAVRRRQLLLAGTGGAPVDLVLDVGANVGQYGRGLRALGYAGRIVSFEPMAGPFRELEAVARADGRWEALACGLGDAPGNAQINVAGNSVSSSILDMLDAHAQASPTSRYVASETIALETLDGVYDRVAGDAVEPWLKIDVQGFEDRVLAGAAATLPRLRYLQLELSLRPLYRDQATYLDLCAWLDARGFQLVGIEPGFLDPATGQLLQFDGIFRRRNA